MPIALPPSPGAGHAIVRFLDHADRRIRRYIRAKEKLIGLLEEQKQAILHQAVTGKIDVRTGEALSRSTNLWVWSSWGRCQSIGKLVPFKAASRLPGRSWDYGMLDFQVNYRESPCCDILSPQH